MLNCVTQSAPPPPSAAQRFGSLTTALTPVCSGAYRSSSDGARKPELTVARNRNWSFSFHFAPSLPVAWENEPALLIELLAMFATMVGSSATVLPLASSVVKLSATSVAPLRLFGLVVE